MAAPKKAKKNTGRVKSKPAKAKAPSSKAKPAAKKIVSKKAGSKKIKSSPPPQPSKEEREVLLRRELVKLKDDILKEAHKEISKYIKGENRQLVETALDEGDWSVVDLSEDINLRQLSVHRDNLRKIDQALRKLQEGTYGICEECGDEISMERLRVMPFAIYCRDDQEKKEMMEALEKETR